MSAPPRHASTKAPRTATSPALRRERLAVAVDLAVGLGDLRALLAMPVPSPCSCAGCTFAAEFPLDALEVPEAAACQIADNLAVIAGCVDASTAAFNALASIGRRAPREQLPRCGARCRDGHPCEARVVRRALWGSPGGEVRRRCRMHGGASTGPRTAAGRERSLAALARGRAVLAARRAVTR